MFKNIDQDWIMGMDYSFDMVDDFKTDNEIKVFTIVFTDSGLEVGLEDKNIILQVTQLIILSTICLQFFCRC